MAIWRILETLFGMSARSWAGESVFLDILTGIQITIAEPYETRTPFEFIGA